MSQSIAAKFDRACNIIDKYERNPNKLIAILQEMQEEYKYLPEEIMTFVSTALGISPSAVYGVATFYSHFTLEPKGKHVIKICDGTACHVKKSEDILKALEKQLGLGKKSKTTGDMLFTLETVACLGACGLAPVVVIDERVHGLMTPEGTVALVEKIKAEEGVGNYV
ncbi:MAG: NADH-quinone oxidoreductase subunit NuoE [Firmicutes bacterium HGW-Firmicutes-11]|jgi:NADH-quinone oxidoreductase subunit E|nr:MAG: NADH-quinone oxidoreductase subunit NuoE [Firmicutes bacterium HGW-Firmicutes-11]